MVCVCVLAKQEHHYHHNFHAFTWPSDSLFIELNERHELLDEGERRRMPMKNVHGKNLIIFIASKVLSFHSFLLNFDLFFWSKLFFRMWNYIFSSVIFMKNFGDKCCYVKRIVHLIASNEIEGNELTLRKGR